MILHRRTLLAALAALPLAACGEPSISDLMAAQERESAAAAAENLRQAEIFLARERAREGMIALANGVFYRRDRAAPNANAATPTPAAAVLVNYEGRLADGEIFDSSFARGEPAEFPLRAVIPGFAAGLAAMRPGEAITLYIPPDQGYGEAGQPGSIPPNAALIFRIELISFREPGAAR